MSRHLFLSVVVISVLFACQESSINQDQLIHKWQMGAIHQNGQDVSAWHNPEQNRWIELKADGTFVSDGDPYGRNTGKWTFDETTRELYLDSDAGEGDDSYWILARTDGDLLLSGARSEFTQQFSMVWKK